MRSIAKLFLIVVLLLPNLSLAQLAVTELTAWADPAGARVRPLESLVIQARAYGEVKQDAESEAEKVRLQRNGASFHLKNSKGGWLSKPFRFQGKDDESFYQERGSGLGAILLGRATGSFVLQDAALFTASEKTGRYVVEVNLEGKTASIEIEVTPTAPARRPEEKTNFGQEAGSSDPYRGLAEHYAPFVAEETWFQPKSDYLARFDLDGDWRGDNNWERAEVGSSQAYVHYAAMETETHWFLIYNFFHPRDYSDKCVAGTCHENDNEGMILTISKDGSTYGRLQTMESLAHNNIYSYQNDRQVKKGVHSFDGKVEFHDGSHPVIFIESGGHGVYGGADHHSRYSVSKDAFSIGTGVTYSYKGKAERPKHPNDRNVGYQLLPIYEHWWLRAHEGGGKGDRAFDAFYAYQPYGGRPRPKQIEIAGSFLGRKFGSNKAKPFWGWHDNRTRKKKVVATGQWGLDPAYSVSQNLRFPGRFSQQYIYNPYLGIGSPGALDAVSTPVAAPVVVASPRRSAPSAPARARSSVPEGVAGGQSGLTDAVAHLKGFQAPRSNDYNSSSKQGQFDIRMHVDGEIDFFVRGDMIRYQVLGGRPPEDDGSEHSQPIPRATLRRFELEKKDGRGQVTLVEPPSSANNFTARFKISDPKGSDDRYHARLRWEAGVAVARETVAAPPRSRTVSPPSASPPVASPQVTSPAVSSAGGASAAGSGSAAALPTLPDDPRAGQREPATAAAPGRSRVLSKHMEAILRGPRTAAPAPAEAPAPQAPAKIDLPGVEIFSGDNDPSRYNDADSGVFEFRGRVDGVARIRIRGDRVLAESEGGRPLAVERFSFTQPVPSARVGDMRVETKDGRGKIVLLERPWEGNHFMAVVEISDPKSGDDRYHFRLTWEK